MMETTDRPGQATDDAVQAAFRAGVRGAPVGLAAYGLAEDHAPFASGPSEALMAETRRLPGLTDAEGAYGTGRVLRRLALLLDRVGAPPSIARQFRDNLAGAVVTHRMRRQRQGWSEDDTVQMVLEMWDRVFGEADATRTRLAEMLTADDMRPGAPKKRSLFSLAWRR
ncbi:hypothetical protein [Geminicoccus roseus]|uniref:hypothetical protein n=1 Tax=Geminicoccus roseus TaxID=404900 RepID=UPI0004893091|nr:hypothetical protein [Geminicoccus roseus]